jgi:hypothetical protein
VAQTVLASHVSNMETCTDHGLKGNKPQGYHQVRRDGKLQYVHRLALATHLGVPVDKLLLVRHLCNNPRCVNPKHLAEGTHQDNADDRVAANRSAKRVPSRVLLTSEQAQDMRKLYASKTTYHGYPSLVDLATMFDVSTTVVKDVVNKRGAYAE